MKMFLKNRMWREHWQVIAGSLVIIVALFGWFFLQAATSTRSVHFIQLSEPADVHRVFQSGEPWLVLCSRPDAILPEVFEKATKRLEGKIHVGVVDCHDKLPSGKSVFKKFLLRDDIVPTIFTIANGGKPKQVIPLHSSRPPPSCPALAAQTLVQVQKSLHEVQSTKQLDDKCLKASTACVLIHRAGKQKFDEYQKQWLQALMHEHRLVKFVWMDASILKLSVDSLFKKPITDSSHHRLVLFKKATNRGASSQWTAKAYTSYFDQLPVQAFLNEYATAPVPSQSFRTLTKQVTVTRRAKKVQSAPPSRTPQEVAELERLRRERMEEESKEHFPQGVDEDGSDAHPTADDNDEEEEEVLDLDEL
ncbi:hypothetical protein DYB38_007162 [Aphanomyces astaci]|uniref:Thioredoxin domain-containing protein n=4 Tax=Aphanomyces astaci TaxID=112090 RepID=A0A397DSM0_APHAT|nr:hypothetical protein DYB38_007162 [Aphanomyces astaci]